jgi:PAS domain S-box-containing protein
MAQFTDGNQSRQFDDSSFARVLAQSGEMGMRIREFDWSATPLGPIESWPQSLRTIVSIMLTSRQPIWIGWGPELIKLYNDPYKAIVGGKHPTALGQPASVVWRDIWPDIAPMLKQVMEHNEGTYVESQLLIMERYGYAEETYYTFSYNPVLSETGGVGGMICTNTDDTQRVIGERQLALLRSLAANTAEAKQVDEAARLAAASLERNPYDLPFALIYLLDSNNQAVTLAGVTNISTDHLAVPQSVALASDSLWPFRDVFQTGTATVITLSPQHHGQLPTGTWHQPPHQAVVIPIMGSGETGQAAVLIVGLNPFRQLDSNYQGFLDLVAGQIASSLANARAYAEERRRVEALAELDRAKTLFYSNVSHEVRTPLTLMLGPIEDALQDPRTIPANQERLTVAHRNALRLLKLINTLLDFSRLESSRMQALYEPTDVATYTTDLASTFRSAIEKAGIEYIIHAPPLTDMVYVDREMWEKIVFNLISNAFKYTPSGTIRVALQQETDAVVLSVSDTGVGIPQAELPHIFERFHRVKGTVGRTHEGTGIGLSLVQELVKLHGGALGVESTFGQGSTFTVSIPLGRAHLPAESVSEARRTVSTIPASSAYVEEALQWISGSGEQDNLLPDLPPDAPVEMLSQQTFVGETRKARILLADDNTDMRAYIARLLAKRYEVEAVSDGQQALEAVRKTNPDLVITDVMMPHLDGFGVLDSLRADEATRMIPVIMLSARAGEEARIEGMEAGADDYLVKPFSGRELLARVNAQIELRQLRDRMLAAEQAARIVAETESERANNILNSMSDAFVTLDRDFRFISLNPRAQNLLFDLTGETVDAFIGQVIWEKLPDSEESVFGESFKRALDEQIPLTVESLFVPVRRWFEVRVYPIQNGLSVYFQDITERKQAEKTLEQYAKDLKRSNDELEQFAYVASHDLQEPLRTIASYMELLNMQYADKLDQDAQEIIDFAVSGAKRLRALIQDLLAYSRVTANARATFAAFNTGKALETALKNLHKEVEETQATLIYEALPTIIGNEGQFVQLFQNLISNAIKFRRDIKPEIRVNAQSQGTEWLFTVRDNGIGMEAPYLERIFVIFSRLHSQEAYPGTGIGLAICKKVVEYHKGRLWVESQAGQGTTFYFTIPIVPS